MKLRLLKRFVQCSKRGRVSPFTVKVSMGIEGIPTCVLFWIRHLVLWEWPMLHARRRERENPFSFC